MTFQGVKNKINKHYIWDFRRKLNRIFYPSLIQSDITILSQNCVGGIVSHTYNMPFNSPTVNMYMDTPDFVKFCLNLDSYLTLKHEYLPELSKERGYIVTKLGDIIIYGVHYYNFDEFCKTWARRVQRVNKSKIIVILSDRDKYDDNLLPSIEKIPYKKILYSYKESLRYDFVVKVPKDPIANTCCMLTEFYGFSGLHVCEKYYKYPQLFKSFV